MVIALLLAACAGPQPKPPAEPEADTGEPERAQRERARNLVERERPLAAVRVYRRLAERSDAEQRQRLRLRIVEVLFEADYPKLALAWHRRLDAGRVPADLITRKRLVDARAAVEQRQGVRALRLLPVITSDTPKALRIKILGLRGDAYGVTGQPIRGVQARLARAKLLESDEARQRNNEAIWDLLQSIPADRLEQLSARKEAPVLRGWLELVRGVRKARLGERGITRSLADWRERFPGHPAQAFSRALEDRVVAELDYPDQIALLLPLSGRLSTPAKAIRDGILAAYYDQPDYVTRPRIEIYDTGTKGTTALSAYRRAVDQGAGFVLGPLAKSAVAKLAAKDTLDVPVLSLNYPRELSETPPDNLYQFGLLPEDEARQAAEAATQNDHFNATALVPSGQWGERMLNAFRSRLSELGGVTLEFAWYNPKSADYGRGIKDLFNLDASYARKRRLESTIGRDVTFEPRRRQDVEVVFTAAMPEQARLIKPQLEFHRAAELPVYATSHVYTGTPNPDADWDMNGLNFTETPWLLDHLQQAKRAQSDSAPAASSDDTGGGNASGETQEAKTPASPASQSLYQRVARLWPQRHKRVPRLYALGVDAFSLVPHLGRLADEVTAGLAGRTGRLTVDDNHRVHRKLQWARFNEGVPVPIPRPEAPIGDGDEEPTGKDVRERAQDS